ncbi:hypothetical protein DOE76_09395 [Leifsonia sp. ku-ls]|nr:hypothetical protein DOE76_09395 [Leifsonia sp. ku-ls]
MRRMARARVTAGIAAAGLALGALLLPRTAVADTVTGTIAVGTGSFAEALSPDGSRLYVGSLTGADSGSVTVVDTASRRTSTIDTGTPSIVALALSPDGSRLYTAHQGGAVDVVDTATGAVLATATPSSSAYGVAVSPDGTRLYVSDFQGSQVLVLDASTLAEIAPRITAGPSPRLLTIKPDGTRAYVADQGAPVSGQPGSVAVLDLTTNSFVTSIGTGGLGTWAVQVSPDGKHVYASNPSSDSISVIDTATNRVSGIIRPGLATPYQVKFTPDGTRAYVTNLANDSVSVIDTSAGAVVSAMTVGTTPTALTIAPDGRTAYVANQLSNTVSVIALDTFPEITTTALPDGTAGTAYSATVASTGRPAPTLSVTSGTLPPGLSLDPAGGISGTPTADGTFTFTLTAASTVSGIAGSAQRTLSITIAPPPPAELIATDDDFSATPIPVTGGTAGDVLANDTLDGSAATASTVTLTLTDDDGIAGATLRADGTLTIPAGATGGTHTLAYRACVTAEPQNCATATVTLRVQAATTAPTAPGSADPGVATPAGVPPAPVLASTGSDVALPIAAAAAIVVLAGTALVAARRRRAAQD